MEVATKQQQLKCLICLEFCPSNLAVELQPCGHLMCADCFLVFPQKLKSSKCPACTQVIATFGPDKQVFAPLVSNAKQIG